MAHFFSQHIFIQRSLSHLAIIAPTTGWGNALDALAFTLHGPQIIFIHHPCNSKDIQLGLRSQTYQSSAYFEPKQSFHGMLATDEATIKKKSTLEPSMVH